MGTVADERHGDGPDIEARVVALESRSVATVASVDTLRSDFETHRVAMQPVIDGIETMRSGIHAIGKFGEFCNRLACLVSKLGTRTGKFIMGVGVLWLMVKFIFGGASWADVSAAVSRLLGR